jgi:hypothetical protein
VTSLAALEVAMVLIWATLALVGTALWGWGWIGAPTGRPDSEWSHQAHRTRLASLEARLAALEARSLPRSTREPTWTPLGPPTPTRGGKVPTGTVPAHPRPPRGGSGVTPSARPPGVYVHPTPPPGHAPWCPGDHHPSTHCPPGPHTPTATEATHVLVHTPACSRLHGPFDHCTPATR